MEKNVTSTIATTEANCMIANFAENTFTERVIKLVGTFENVEAVKKAVNEQLTGMNICGKVLNYTDTCAKYSMPESRFYQIATQVEKRSNGAYIFRTVKTLKTCGIVYDIENNSIFDTEAIYSKKSVDKNTMRKLFTQFETEHYSIVGVKTLETIEACYQVDCLTFIKNAVTVETC